MTEDEDQVRRMTAVSDEIMRVARRVGRDLAELTVIAVSKQQPRSRVIAALAWGQLHFGENRVAEAVEKFAPLRAAHPRAQLHMVGALQTNKLAALRHFDAIHSLDRLSLAEGLAKQSFCPPCFIQVNTGAEPQKGGVLPAALGPFLADCRERLALPIVGLMCLPPANDQPGPHFAMLHRLAEREGLKQLSMGMSGDFASAITLGATHLRLGTAFFGARPHGEATAAT